MSAPKRQKVSTEGWLLKLCKDSRTFFEFLEAWQAEPAFPTQDETLTFESLVRFFQITFHTPFKLAEELSGFYFDGIARGLGIIEYSWNRYNLFTYLFESWLARVYPSLQIKYPISEPMRRELLNVHVKYDFWKWDYSHDDRFRTEPYVLYWLTPPQFRHLFFQSKIQDWDGIVEARDFDGEKVIELLQPGDNMTFYVWALWQLRYKTRGMIGRDLNRLVIDVTERTCLHNAIVDCIENELEFNIDTFDEDRMNALVIFENKKYSNLPHVPSFSDCPTTIVKREELWRLRDYLAIAHGCDVCVCEAVVWAYRWAQETMEYY